MKLATNSWRILLMGGGIIALALGIAGIVLPLLPTTPFLLLAAFCFANSSPRLHAWLLDHPTFGPSIRNWRRYHAIARRAKWMGTLSMGLVLVAGALLALPPWILGLQALALCGVCLFLWTRPEPPSEP